MAATAGLQLYTSLSMKPLITTTKLLFIHDEPENRDKKRVLL